MKNNSIATLSAALSVAALLIAPGLSSAQTAAAQPAAEAAKPTKVAANTPRARTPAKSRAPVADAALTPAELAVAERVHVGQMPCELGASVSVSADPKAPGYFHMHGKNFRYRMAPVVSSTGTVRLEDTKAGTVWLQMPNKSMLMNQKMGKRLADECMSPVQVAAVQAAKDQPAANLLDAAKPVAAASAPAAQPASAATN